MYKILLLTNRDSDNVGDQVIEACDISLIETVMQNLNIKADEFEIISKAAGIISKRYLETREPELLQYAEKLVSEADIVVFGGAPLFNYLYQNFYERTAVTLELAQKYNKPVIFSAIGVDGYDEDNEKCQRLKTTLNFDCVKQITTRDDFESLKKFINNENILIDKVSDPAVFTAPVFRNYITSEKKNEKKKIGVFILRSNGFKDNKYDFSRTDAIKLWEDIVDELENNEDYQYELVTNGHFGDEAFLEFIIRKNNYNLEKCVFNINNPERLVGKISEYDAIISCRLHPSIISFSLGVPSVGLVYNSKVKHFYDTIGYSDRCFEVGDIDSKKIVEKVEQIIGKDIDKAQDFMISVYKSLFNGIKSIVCSDSMVEPYDYNELVEKIVAFEGTSEQEQLNKLERKFKRAYGKYNDLFELKIENTAKIRELEHRLRTIEHSRSWKMFENLQKIKKKMFRG